MYVHLDLINNKDTILVSFIHTKGYHFNFYKKNFFNHIKGTTKNIKYYKISIQFKYN
jgi:hypothetical protein